MDDRDIISLLGTALILALFAVWRLIVASRLTMEDNRQLERRVKGYPAELDQVAQDARSAAIAEGVQSEADAVAHANRICDARVRGAEQSNMALSTQVDKLQRDIIYLNAQAEEDEQSLLDAIARRDEALKQMDVITHELRDATATLSNLGKESKRTKYQRDYQREVDEYRALHPEHNKTQCRKALGIGSNNTINKYWNAPPD